MWSENQLDERLSCPTEQLIRDMEKLDGDIMILGAGGKVGPTLSVMAKRTSDLCGKKRNVYAVSRFTDPYVMALLEKENVTTITADLSDEAQIQKLPRVPNVIYMLGRKFGTCENACETWATNVGVPAMVTRHFGAARYVVFSTGNVYPFSSTSSAGCDESVSPEPVGEYGMSSLGRERIFEYAARHYGASVLIYRLNYAVDLRYGVLFDLAQKIRNGEPISVKVPAFNCVWQHYANEVALRSLLHATPAVEYLNVTGPETIFVRDVARKLAEAMGCAVVFEGEEGTKALLSNSQKCIRLFGYPSIGVEEMLRLQAQWVMGGGRKLGKPTHFEESEGKF